MWTERQRVRKSEKRGKSDRESWQIIRGQEGYNRTLNDWKKVLVPNDVRNLLKEWWLLLANVVVDTLYESVSGFNGHNSISNQNINIPDYFLLFRLQLAVGSCAFLLTEAYLWWTRILHGKSHSVHRFLIVSTVPVTLAWYNFRTCLNNNLLQ